MGSIARRHARRTGLQAIVALAACATVAHAQPTLTRADHAPVLVELFTSQGCSSCPRANALIGALSREPNTIALTYAVGYWDYLGWRDTFAKPEFTARQKWYGQRFHHGIYTPQIVVNGVAHNNALKPGQLKTLASSAAMAGGVRVDAQVREGHAEVTVSGAQRGAGEVWLAQYQPGEAEVAVSRGENAGVRVPHYNVVTSLQRLGAWRGGVQHYDGACAPACAVIVQNANGRVLTAQLAH
ncbi:MAG: DUF1223 domain-containing protein [Hyphomonadaceae bacterium]